jgi:hypothetical protein
MRDVLTTAVEVAGMICIAIAVAVASGAAWAGFALSGVALIAAGVIEARR